MTRNDHLTTDIRRCHPLTRPEAFALAAEAWPKAELLAHRAVIEQLVQQGRGKEILLLAAWSGETPSAALIGQALAGKCAAAWLPQFTADFCGDRMSVGRLLLDALSRELATSGVHLVQSLLPGDQAAGSEYLTSARFQHVADLLYLTAPEECFPEAPLQLPFHLESYNPQEKARLARLIDRTYQGTLDCPAVDGLRETADVLAGYQTVGDFRPELWQIARLDGQDLGCLLVNVHTALRQAEIVYTGLVPEARGKGFGVELTRHALWLARKLACEQVVLAVDALNHHAIRMYAAAGFTQWDRRALWIKSLRELTTPVPTAT